MCTVEKTRARGETNERESYRLNTRPDFLRSLASFSPSLQAKIEKKKKMKEEDEEKKEKKKKRNRKSMEI